MVDVRSHVQTGTCDLEVCAVDCKLWDWTSWSDCSLGTREKRRGSARRNLEVMSVVRNSISCHVFVLSGVTCGSGISERRRDVQVKHLKHLKHLSWEVLRSDGVTCKNSAISRFHLGHGGKDRNLMEPCSKIAAFHSHRCRLRLVAEIVTP